MLLLCICEFYLLIGKKKFSLKLSRWSLKELFQQLFQKVLLEFLEKFLVLQVKVLIERYITIDSFFLHKIQSIPFLCTGSFFSVSFESIALIFCTLVPWLYVFKFSCKFVQIWSSYSGPVPKRIGWTFSVKLLSWF